MVRALATVAILINGGFFSMKKKIPDFQERNGMANSIVYPAAFSRWIAFGVTPTCTFDYYELSLKTAEFEVC